MDTQQHLTFYSSLCSSLAGRMTCLLQWWSSDAGAALGQLHRAEGMTLLGARTPMQHVTSADTHYAPDTPSAPAADHTDAEHTVMHLLQVHDGRGLHTHMQAGATLVLACKCLTRRVRRCPLLLARKSLQSIGSAALPASQVWSAATSTVHAGFAKHGVQPTSRGAPSPNSTHTCSDASGTPTLHPLPLNGISNESCCQLSLQGRVCMAHSHTADQSEGLAGIQRGCAVERGHAQGTKQAQTTQQVPPPESAGKNNVLVTALHQYNVL